MRQTTWQGPDDLITCKGANEEAEAGEFVLPSKKMLSTLSRSSFRGKRVMIQKFLHLSIGTRNN